MKILVIRFGAIGDVVQALPIAKTLKIVYGEDCKITWLTSDACSELVSSNQYICRVKTLQEEKNKIILFSLKKALVREFNKRFAKNKILYKMINAIINNKTNDQYDLIIDLQQNTYSAVFDTYYNASKKFSFSFINDLEKISEKYISNNIGKTLTYTGKISAFFAVNNALMLNKEHITKKIAQIPFLINGGRTN